jgi:hypothetical protein
MGLALLGLILGELWVRLVCACNPFGQEIPLLIYESFRLVVRRLASPYDLVFWDFQSHRRG